ncbi:MAG: FAD-dependent oxidoreductase [candidate division Zixibacteria bacterium]|nr:FAD-dependent oxidoreductase [candidate division Zixibacteria bacterium]
MDKLTFTIDGQSVECPKGSSILEAADAAGTYIPRMCFHPDLPPCMEVTWSDTVQQIENTVSGEKAGSSAGEEAHCGLCLVEIEGQAELVNSCMTPAESGLVVSTNSEIVIGKRQQALSRLLADHPHACLTCAQKEGCSRTDCSSNVPVEERCCTLLGNCELEKVSDYIGIPGNTPRYVPSPLAASRKTTNDPLFDRDYNLCIGCLRCVRVCHEVQGLDILGATWKDGRARVGTLTASGLKEAQCRFCGACVEVCPTGALLDQDGAEIVRCDSPLPCVDHCPAGIDIPRYIAAIAAGQDKQALRTIRERVPFPGILGYVCFHPCEDACRRGGVDQPVAICELKRYAADAELVLDQDRVTKKSDTGKRVAIVGSGPAGSTAAFYLSRAGHNVELFDRESKPGGMLRYGIPDYRLPKDVLDREFEVLKTLGVGLRMDHHFESESPMDELKSQGFDAILLAIGVSESHSLPIKNTDLDGVYPALEFLKSATKSRTPRLKGQVAVIGGGNVAIDAAMTAVRLGADSVQLICLEPRDTMPAHDWEVAQAEDEGVEIHPSWGPVRFVSTDGRLSGIELKKCVSVFDPQGRFAPQFDESQTETVAAEAVIVAIGQATDADFLQNCDGISTGPGNTIKIEDEMAAGPESVFAAGDVTRGPSSVIDAIAEGRKAAEAIDKYLGGTGLIDAAKAETSFMESDISGDQFGQSRQNSEVANPQERKSDFGVITATLSESAARSEAQRCLRCYIRQGITPITLPPEQWQPFNNEAVDSVPEKEGVFQLLDADKKVLRITGTMNLRQDLKGCLHESGKAVWFVWEEEPMYTKRESELMQQYLQAHGELPGGGDDDDLDDLF